MSYNLIPKFETKEETFDFIHKNINKINSQKSAAIKFADSNSVSCFYVSKEGDLLTEKSFLANKELVISENSPIKVKAIINTTNLLDSHGDVHIKGIWKKCLKETKDFSLIKEHNFSFDGTISDEVKAYTQTYTWGDLGITGLKGDTEALVFDAIIQSNDKTGMYERYKNGVVKNHSVGMRYINYAVCMNTEDENYQSYKSNWDKYIDQVANKSEAIEAGYFWAIIEAKAVEGSAVKRGSNWATPTQEVTQEVKSTEDSTTEPEPAVATQEQPDQKNWIDYINNKQF
jgi:hypothetical protein